MTNDPNHDPDRLYISDVFAEGVSPDAVEADIFEAVQSMDGTAEGRRAKQNMGLAHSFVRYVSKRVLKRLQASGIEEASQLELDLMAIDPTERPLDADMSTVARVYFDRQHETDDPVEQRQSARMGRLADAVAAIATTEAVFEASKDRPDGPRSGHALLEYAREMVEAAVVEEDTDELRIALASQIDRIDPDKN